MTGMTYRERRAAKAERLRGWAATREQRATAQLESHPETRHDWAFITQPGHIPARARMIAADDRALESLAKARSMSSRADGIEAAAAGAIYSDDPDAIERLEERIAKLEGERDAIKAYNASCRKAAKAGGTGDTSLLTEAQRKDLLSTARHSAYMLGKGGAMPAYHLTNLSGNITRQRKRLEQLKRAAAAAAEGDQ